MSPSDVIFIMLINLKKPKIVGILKFMSIIYFVLSWVWKSFIISSVGLQIRRMELQNNFRTFPLYILIQVCNCVIDNLFSWFSTKTYIVDIKMVILSIQNTLMVKELIAILHAKTLICHSTHQVWTHFTVPITNHDWGWSVFSRSKVNFIGFVKFNNANT